MSDRPHGYARYRLDGCRCYTCGWARSQYDDNRNRAIIAGTWKPYVDAEPVRIHIRHLQACGMGLRAIAAAARVDRKRLVGVTTGRTDRGTGPQAKVRPDFAAAVLAVEPTLETLGGSTIIAGTGTTRRLQALVAGGWPQTYLAPQLNITLSNFGRVLGAQRVRVSTARAARTVYDDCWRADPQKYGATPGGISRARQLAAARGWAPVGAWDDDTIDDPNAFPDWTGHCGTPGGYHAHHRLKIPYCQPCRDAYVAQQREARRARRAANDTAGRRDRLTGSQKETVCG